MLREVLVENLIFYRTKKKISQEKLSEAIHKNSNYINQIENRATFPSPEAIEDIAAVLEINPLKFFEINRDIEKIQIDCEIENESVIRDELSKILMKAANEFCDKLYSNRTSNIHKNQI